MEPKAAELIDRLYRELAPRLVRYARGALGGRIELAEEAVQIAFMEACEKSEALLASENPHGWIVNAVRIVIKKLVAEQRRLAELIRRAEAQLAPDAQAAPDPQLSAPDLLYGDLAADEDFKLLRRYSETGCSIAELAADYGISFEAAKKRVQRARKRLRKIFEDSE